MVVIYELICQILQAAVQNFRQSGCARQKHRLEEILEQMHQTMQ